MPDTLPIPARRISDPRELLAGALAWIGENPEAWSIIVRAAQRDALEIGHVRVKSYIETLRYRKVTSATDEVKLPNAFSAVFGRILREWYPELAFAIPLNASKLDGMVIPPKPSES